MDKKEKRKKKKEAKQHGVMRVVYMCDDKQTFHIHLTIIKIKNHKKLRISLLNLINIIFKEI